MAAGTQRTEEQARKAKKGWSREGFQDKYGRFSFGRPPANTGDYAFIQHIIASTAEAGRCGVVCPQGVLFRGQPEVEEETGEFAADSTPVIRRRKADDEHLIRKGIIEARLIDAVIALPLNIFYGAGVPACLLILRKGRPAARRDKLLLIYAARHYRELSNKNQLRPQDVMRILVHYHAYGDGTRARDLVAHHSGRLQGVVTRDENDEADRITEEYAERAGKLAELADQIAENQAALAAVEKATERAKLEKAGARLAAAADKLRRELARRDERIAEVRQRAEDERAAIHTVGEELIALYADPAELAKHARVVALDEVVENEYNLNIPRYVDTFEPEVPIDVAQALAELDVAEQARQEAERYLRGLLREAGYAAD